MQSPVRAQGGTLCRGLGRNAKPDAVTCESKQANRPQGDEASGDSEWMGFYNAQTTRPAILPGGSFNLFKRCSKGCNPLSGRRGGNPLPGFGAERKA